MKTILASLVLALGLASPLQAQNPETILPRNLLLVSDLEASKKFYAYALGLEITRDAPIADKITFKHLGIAETHTAHIVVLRPSPTLNGLPRESAMLALLQVSNPPLPKIQRPANLAVGEVALALRTNDIETVIKRLKEIGATFAVEPVRTPDGLIEMAVLDPDGVRMQINQRPDSEREKAARK
ncbi:MAG: VOC family protein [Rhodospirillaceae bacterium]|nr:VOC family protein [Rhodospirillaceae bacterium]